MHEWMGRAAQALREGLWSRPAYLLCHRCSAWACGLRRLDCGCRGDDVVVHPYLVSRLVELLRVLRECMLPYVRMNSLLAVALLWSPISRYLSPGSDSASPHRLNQLMTCSVQLADARSQASALLDEGRYNNASPHSIIMYLLQHHDVPSPA